MPIGNQRNKLCPCGSGKKFKKCCINKKQRKVSITMDMGKPVAMNGLRISSRGSIELLKDNLPLIPVDDVYHDVNFDRKKGPKILNKTPLDPDKLIINPNIALQKFDKIFAMDTNTKTNNGEIISVSCVLLCQLTSHNKIVLAEYAPIHCLEFRNIQSQIENIAWIKYFQLMTATPYHYNFSKIGFIVDSDLGNIPAYNNRTKAIYSNYYLPQNIELIYASADVGKEYLANMLISLCDKEATKLLENILSNKVTNDNLHEESNEPYTHFRFWNR
ncbi:SEC-C domain-containing protein [Candidatus Halobeggiatoa sp. HSG11]|nr:SEC-C domain-containing protein [Candidatus Halobeggiatoa sp. HSG11]